MDIGYGESPAEKLNDDLEGEWVVEREECPVCGKDLPFNSCECDSCGYQADQFFLTEQVMTSRVSKRTFDMPSGGVKQSGAPIVTEPARKKKSLFSKNKGTGRDPVRGNGNGNGKRQWK